MGLDAEAEDKKIDYLRGRSDAFDHGKPETVLAYLDREDPSPEELLTIVRNILRRLPPS